MKFFIAFLLLFSSTLILAETTQEHVHHMSHGVMPFDMSATTHVFKMTESGGIQRVIVKNPEDVEQISLIQKHLQHEALNFQHGDYSDPAMLHGEGMPGLRELQTGAAQIKVTYSAIATGPEISFETTDLHLLTAIHRWFGAQLSEHGADARPE